MPNFKLKTTLQLILLLSYTCVLAQFSLVRDINESPNSDSDGSVSDIIVYKDHMYFSAHHSELGRQFWKSDGTPEGTSILKIIEPPINGFSLDYPIVSGDYLYFAIQTHGHGDELWKTDGTEEGTHLVKDIFPGGEANIYQVFSFKDKIYFSAMDAAHGRELWVSDGSFDGTHMVKDIFPGEEGSSPSYFTIHDDVFYFTAVTEAGRELWLSDGSNRGTKMIIDLTEGPDSSDIRELTVFGGDLYFTKSKEDEGHELWRSGGTPETTQKVLEFLVGTEYATIANLYGAGQYLYFGSSNEGLWRSDGSLEGTSVVYDVDQYPISGYEPLAFINGKLIFSGRGDLWCTDGSDAGAVKISPENFQPWSHNRYYKMDDGNFVYFVASDGTHSNNGTTGYELWRSDGTVENTHMIRDIMEGTSSSNVRFPAVYNGKVYFRASDGIYGSELWVTDGTEEGTRLAMDILNTSQSSEPKNFTESNGKLYFTANDGLNGSELWVSDGTESGTAMVRDIYLGTESSDPRFLTDVNGQLFFAARDEERGRELWKSDGTEAGTLLVKDIGEASGGIESLSNVDGTLYFQALRELWKSDGTEEGTIRLEDIAAGEYGRDPEEITSGNGMIFYRGRNQDYDSELYRADETIDGTFMVKDIFEDRGGYPEHMRLYNGLLYFTALESGLGRELWVSDGTESGTHILKDIAPGSNSSSPEYFALYDNYLYFSADHLWRTDGTTDGTQKIVDTRDGNGSSIVEDLVVAADLLFFTAYDGDFYEVWVTDGTSSGTKKVSNGQWSSQGKPYSLVEHQGMLYFMGNNDCGLGIYSSDGTHVGTQLLDIFPGESVEQLYSIGNDLYLAGEDFQKDEELWKYEKTQDIDPPILDVSGIYLVLDENGFAALTPDMVDQYTIDEKSPRCFLTFEVDMESFYCDHLGENTVTFSASDPSGNTASQDVIITVVDRIPPQIDAVNRTSVYVIPDGLANLEIHTVARVESSIDNCSMGEFWLKKSKFTKEEIGDNEMYLYGSDQSGNVDSTDFIVNVGLNLNDGHLSETVELRDLFRDYPFDELSDFSLFSNYQSTLEIEIDGGQLHLNAIDLGRLRLIVHADHNGEDVSEAFGVVVGALMNLDSDMLQFEVFPNPVSDRLIIQGIDSDWSSVRVTLVDMAGHLIDAQLIHGNGSSEIDTSMLKAGMYFLQIDNGKKASTIKFVKGK